MKYILIITFLFCSTLFNAQGDTLLLQDKEQIEIPIEREEGTFIHRIDSIDILLNYSNGLSELFRNSSSFNVNSLGQGNVNSLSFRGLRAENTRVDWHGINLNPPSTFLTDLSLIRSSLFNQISLHSEELPGSVLKLDNQVYWDDKSIEAGLGFSSFKGRDYSATYHIGNKDFYSRSHFDYFKKDNEFYYRNLDSLGTLIQQRTNAAQRGFNFQQDVGYISRGRSSTNTYSGHIWYSKFNRDFPRDIRLPEAYANQRDRSFRLALKSVLEDGDFQWSNVLGYINDKQDYTEDSIVNPIDSVPLVSQYKQRRIHLNSGFRYKLSSFLMSGGIELRTMNVTSENYGLIKPESAAGFWFKGQKNWNRARLVLALKQEFSSVFKVPFSLSLGYDHYFRKSKIWASAKRIGRTATYENLFNREYGNPELGPESGWTFETGWEWRPGENANFSINVFTSNINNWIQLISDSVQLLRPTNYSSVALSGFNVNYKQFFIGSNADFMSKFSVAYNNTDHRLPLVISEEKFNLIYSPKWTAQLDLALIDGPRRFGYRSKFVDAQFTNNLNENSIPYSWIHDVYFISEIADRVHVSVQANNLANTTYFNIEGYPMYTRNFSINLIYKSIGSEDKAVRAKTRSSKIKFKKRGAW